MTHDLDRSDPQGTRETLPPPPGANEDPYSAQTRVGTLPEDVLEAMRQQVPDASLESRAKSGMERAAARPLAELAVASFAEIAPPAAATPVVAAPLAPPLRGILMGIAVIVMFAALGALLAKVLVLAAS